METHKENLWRKADNAMMQISSGKLVVTKEQINELENLIEGYQAFLKANRQVHCCYAGVLHEKKLFLSKLVYLEKLGVRNKWKHPLLAEIRDIIYEENDQFVVSDFAGSQD